MTKARLTVKKTPSLDDSLLDVVDATLNRVFTEPSAEVIFDFLRKRHNLNREEIAEKPEVFSAGLDRLLGAGAIAIEKLILKSLRSKFQLNYTEGGDCEFSDYIKKLKHKYG
jgi:hypothetical protein